MTFWNRTDEDDPDALLLQQAFRYALSLCGAQHTAKDLVQQAAFKLYRRYGGLRNRSLLFTSVRRLFFDQLRHEKVLQMDSFEQLSAEGELVPFVPSTQGTDIDMGTLLNQLPAGDRELLHLHYVAGYTAREISNLTGHPRNTVLSRLARAREKLRQFLAADGDAAQDGNAKPQA